MIYPGPGQGGDSYPAVSVVVSYARKGRRCLNSPLRKRGRQLDKLGRQNYVNIEKDEHDSENVNGHSVNVSLSTIFEESSSERTEISQQP